MARQESDREDLLREATALIERAELHASGGGETVTAGFRRDGSASFYFGADPVYQFNTAGELRRAFVAGRLIKAQLGRLVALTRERSPGEVALVRTELTDVEQAELLQAAHARLDELSVHLTRGSFELVGQMPPAADVVGRIRRWLAARPEEIAVAARPNVR
jgi:hypothetical protein